MGTGKNKRCSDLLIGQQEIMDFLGYASWHQVMRRKTYDMMPIRKGHRGRWEASKKGLKLWLLWHTGVFDIMRELSAVFNADKIMQNESIKGMYRVMSVIDEKISLTE